MKVILISGHAQCVDADTEYFNGNEWKPISEYKDTEMVLVYHKDGSATLELPERYIKQKCNKLINFSNKRMDQCLSLDHNIVYITSKGNIAKKPVSEMIEQHSKNRTGFPGKFITAFNYGAQGIELSDDEIKLMCAVIADGTFPKNGDRCRIRIKKDRKKEELRAILESLSIDYEEKITESEPEYSRFYFTPPRKEKHFTKYWYGCSHSQLQVICENVHKWDGHNHGTGYSFSSTNLESIEFIQFAYSSCGYRASIYEDNRIGEVHKSICYTVRASKNNLVSIFNRSTNGSPEIFKEYQTKDGYSYCFTVSTGMLVLRRNRKIFVTGNCGKDTSAEIMKEILENNGKTALIVHYGDLVKYVCRQYFNWDGIKDEAGRTLLQYIGTDIVRAKSPDFWAAFVAQFAKVFEDHWEYILVPDTRFPNEVELMYEVEFEDVIHMRVIRPDFDNGLTEEQKNHASETALDNYPADYHIINDGSLQDLRENLIMLMDKLGVI